MFIFSEPADLQNKMASQSQCKSITLLVFSISCMFNMLAYFSYVANRELIQTQYHGNTNDNRFLLLSGNESTQGSVSSSRDNKRILNSFALLSPTAFSEKKIRISALQFLKARLKSPEILSRKLQEEDSSSLDQDVLDDSAENITNPHDFVYVINQPTLCEGDSSLDLVIMVCTGVARFLERQAIRETWALYLKQQKHVKLIFFLGTQSDEEIQEKVSQENETYHDIVQEDFKDSYRNLSIKSVGALKWMKDFCKTAKFGFKVDDDIFVNIPNLMQMLTKISHSRIIMGHLFVNARPVQDKTSKWYTPKEDFPRDIYPPYVSGTSYLVSREAAIDLYHVSLYTKLFWLEDIYITGICAEEAKIKLVHHPEISFMSRIPSGCAFQHAITGHKVTVPEMYQIYTQLRDPKLKCKTGRYFLS